jgi:hypothetical protein
MNIHQLIELHKETSDKTRDIMLRKNSDYTGGVGATDALANFKTAAALGLRPVTGLLLRMQDKLMRIRTFVADGQLSVASESVEDACDDLVNYAILAKALLREERDQSLSPSERSELVTGAFDFLMKKVLTPDKGTLAESAEKKI